MNGKDPLDQFRRVNNRENADSPSGRFVKGPIPLEWLSKAAKLPGKALHVAIALAYLAGLQRNKTIKFAPSVLRMFGINRFAFYRSKKHLSVAGLISSQDRRGRAPMITLVGFHLVRGRASLSQAAEVANARP